MWCDSGFEACEIAYSIDIKDIRGKFRFLPPPRWPDICMICPKTPLPKSERYFMNDP